MHAFKRALVLALTLTPVAISSTAWADDASPVGIWRNIDDVSGKSRALIHITDSNGILQGRIVKVFPGPNEDQNPKCKDCEGTLKNAPLVGLVMLSGLKKDGDEYADGKILDPENGKVYSSTIRLADGGKKLSVRGFVGISALGRSQTWLREK